jgi:sulfatase maturation enzyme AslB (radical SAM superfamily)
MDMTLFRHVLESIADHAVTIQLYNWGESLLHPHFLEILDEIKRYPIRTEVSSHLSMKLADDFVESLVTRGLDRLIVSLDGVSDETYRRYRIGGNFARVRENMQRIQAAKQRLGRSNPRIVWQFLRNRHNVHEVAEARRRFREIGADEVIFPETVTRFMDNDPEHAREWLPDGDLDRRQFFDIDTSFFGRPCMFLHSVMIVEQDGSIPPCCYSTEPTFDFGHFEPGHGARELFNAKRFREARALFAGNPSVESPCRECTMYKTFGSHRRAA